MKEKNEMCLKCGKSKKLTRGYCSSKCYKYLMRNGLIDKLPKIVSPNFLTNEQHQILVGSLLGDGCMFKNRTKYPYFCVRRKLTDVEYLRYEFEFFKAFCNSVDVNTSEVFDDRTKKIYHQCKFTTRTSEVFEDYYQKWYQPEKILPIDLDLTPLVCAVWFCDDGCVTIDKKTDRLKLKLSTHCFTKLENERLQFMLRDKFNEHFSLCCDNKKYYISSSDSGTKKFIKYIENHIPDCISRKITWQDYHFEQKKSPSSLKYRDKLDLTEKEKKLMTVLFECGGSPKEIATKMEWQTQSNKTPSGLTMYLKRFLNYGWLKKSGTLHSYKDVITYSLTEDGFKVCALVGI